MIATYLAIGTGVAAYTIAQLHRASPLTSRDLRDPDLVTGLAVIVVGTVALWPAFVWSALREGSKS